jgi:hypothetical protein
MAWKNGLRVPNVLIRERVKIRDYYMAPLMGELCRTSHQNSERVPDVSHSAMWTDTRYPTPVRAYVDITPCGARPISVQHGRCERVHWKLCPERRPRGAEALPTGMSLGGSLGRYPS